MLILHVADLTELEHREITLWRVWARWVEADTQGRHEDAQRLADGFCRRLGDYERMCAEHGSPTEEVAP